jgi:hypothetical protein
MPIKRTAEDAVLAPVEVMQRARAIAAEHGKEESDFSGFLEFTDFVADVMRMWGGDRLNTPEVYAFAYGMRSLRDEYSRELELDPMIAYRPAHEVSLAFHRSPAFVRYYRAGNRTSKTQTGFAEHYYIVTGTHPFRDFNEPPASTFIVGVNFSKYGVGVFQKKFVAGEPDNELTPMFPEYGRWLNRYDAKRQDLWIACPQCARKNKPKQCRHQKSSIHLFSDLEGPDVLQGSQYNLGHFDEHIREEFFNEAIERLKTVKKSSFILTGTPLLGKSSWEHQRLTSIWNEGPEKNIVPGTKQPYVSIHCIDQYSAGLIPEAAIEASQKGMDPLEMESRIWGRPAPLAKNSVFDRYALHEMEDAVVSPRVGGLASAKENDERSILFTEHPDGHLRVWDEPEAGKQYVIGIDVAAGLTNRDYSCASVLRMPDLKMVAQIHGWIPPNKYADRLMDLGEWYNKALLVVERTGGLGVAVIARLKENGYWNLFRDLTDMSQAAFAQDAVYGVDTNIKTKPQMVACLQQLIAERQIEIPSAPTLEELRAFGQEVTPQGLTVRMRGEGQTHDDRVMSLVVAAYVAISHAHLFDHLKKKDPETTAFWREVHREIDREKKLERDPYSW